MSAGSNSDELTPACIEYVDGFNASAEGCRRAGLCLHNLFDPSDISRVSSPASASWPCLLLPCQLPHVSRLVRSCCVERRSTLPQLFAVGIVISLVSSAVTNLGANVQKLALSRELRRTHVPQRPMYRIPLCADLVDLACRSRWT